MPKRTSYEFDHQWTTCSGPDGCGEMLPPPRAWTGFTRARHDWYHLLKRHSRRIARGGRPTLTEARELVAAAQVYIDELERSHKSRLDRIVELEDRLDDGVGL